LIDLKKYLLTHLVAIFFEAARAAIYWAIDQKSSI
jgi:hypothetical protein